ncbi:hypothetical protein H1V43_39480 [Streptomyces sp. PSKA54]|uniref:Uncharacterized protein n=1 Tax=Streptomyces himalayensis subsp. aureolus TaxID=2758039 RepID=A0A7W2D9H4_9ACTN|nr:DUF6368 family protein [Streptomyces himalayensis]MBA4867252.1 hypothetical protein [Streptomyces himalayensis subsp. aureolus]
MSGPVLVIELAEAVPHSAIQRLREFLVRSSARFEEKRVGEYDLHIRAESLGITDTAGVDGHRPILVSLMGPGIGDEAVFEAEHADEVDQEPLIGFTPTHAVDVIAFCNSPVDHAVTARLTAAIMDVIGGVANAELREDQVPIVAGLPGIVATTNDPGPAAYGSAEFLREWSERPGFRLLK